VLLSSAVSHDLGAGALEPAPQQEELEIIASMMVVIGSARGSSVVNEGNFSETGHSLAHEPMARFEIAADN